MIGIIFILLMSWILLYLTEKKSILCLGLIPNFKRIRQLLIGICLTGTLCGASKLFESFLQSSTWELNQAFSADLLFNAMWWDFKSVLTEELIFRGALLFVLIKKIGIQKSALISAILFGAYHWFSQNIFGNPVAMVLIFIATGLMGFVWALAFSKTESIFLPLGLHFGWNVVHNTVFSKGPLGNILLTAKGGEELSDWMSLFNFMTPLLLTPLILLFYLKYFVKPEYKEFSAYKKVNT